VREDIRWYRILLRLFPAELREQWGSDMEALFRHGMEQAGTSKWKKGRHWLGAIHDALVGAAGEHLRNLRLAGRRKKERIVTMLLQDLRYAARTLLRAPALTLLALTTLALGIGASTATFSVVHAVLLEAPLYHEPDRLVVVWPEKNYNKAMVAMTEEAAPALDSVSGMSGWTLTLVGAGEPVELDGMQVSAHHFELLGVEAELGRTFSRRKDCPATPAWYCCRTPSGRACSAPIPP
jgi:hypothetical protein